MTVDNSKSRIDQERLEQFARYDRAGLSANAIAELMGVTSRTVVRWRNRLGIQHGQLQTRTPEHLREIARQMILDGCSFKDAAETIGVTHPTVRHWFPDLPAWTKSQAGAYAVQVRRFNKVAQATGTRRAA